MAEDSTARLARRLRPIAAAIVLAGLAAAPRGEAAALLPLQPVAAAPITREDGTPLRVAPGAWHTHALEALPAPASAAAIVRPVTSCADAGPGSLRDVVASAASGDTIDLSALTCSSITLETGVIPIRLFGLTIVGPGADRLAIDGNDYDRVFLHYGGGGFAIRDLTVRNGAAVATGFDLGIAGCIASAGYLTLDHSVVTGCLASGEGAYGGAIYAYSLILISSTLSDNLAYGVHPGAGTAAFGGGAFVYQIALAGSTVTGNVADHRVNPPRPSYDIGGGICSVRGGFVLNSTIDSNFADGRGGGLATFSSIEVRNSTISGNTGRTFGGGGLLVRRPANLGLRNSTVTSNRGHDGAGIMLTATHSYFDSSIVAGNVADHGYAGDLSSQALTAGATPVHGENNLVHTISSPITLPADTMRGDPRLGPLAHNGGPTRTHALREGSPAIDAGNNLAEFASDQRGEGYPRIVGAAPDIGAFELTPGGADPIAAPVPSLRSGVAALLAALLGIGGLRSLRRARRLAAAR